MNTKKQTDIIDIHVHCSPQTDTEFLADFLDMTGTDRAVVQAVSHSACISLVPQALTMKQMHPGKFYVFAAPNLREYYSGDSGLGERFVKWTELCIAAGCDGIKFLEGKPQMRKTVPVPDFDLPCWEPFWEYAECSRIPIMWHVNDPENFWNPNASDWIVKQGWHYDESFINNEVQYTQVLNVLEHHPHLKIVFAHFFFMSAQLDRLSSILDRYPEIMLDITPGIEMYENFSADFNSTVEFFRKYHNRICYGTDIGGRCILTNEGCLFNKMENLRRPEIVREFITDCDEHLIESDGNFLISRKPFIMKCLGLKEDERNEIFRDNAMSIIDHEPNAVNADAVLEMCSLLRSQMKTAMETERTFRPDFSVINNAEKHFRFS